MDASPGCGRIPFAHRARILPGVSFPSSVVRSIIRIARSSAQTFDAFLIDRRLSDVTRSWIPTASTGVTRPSRLPRLPARPSNARMSSCARSRVAVSRATDVVMGASLPARRFRPARFFARRGSAGRRRSPRTRKCTNQSRTWTRFSARRYGTPPRVSSWFSSGTRMNRTGRRSERSTVNSDSAWATVVRMSRSECWISSGVRTLAASDSGEIEWKYSGSSHGLRPNSIRAHSAPEMSPVRNSSRMSTTERQVMAARNRSVQPTIQLVR